MSALTGRTIVVAGASGHAGTATCTALLEAGAHVIALGSSPERLVTLDDQLERFSPRLWPYYVDVADIDSMNRLKETINREGVLVDGFVNLIGGWRPTPFGSITADDMDWLDERLVRSVAASANAFADELRTNGGQYVLVSTPTAVKPTKGNAAHGAAKAAAESWVRSLAGHFDGSDARAVTLVVAALVSPADRLAQPERTFKNATETSLLADTITQLFTQPLENGSRTCL